MVETRPAVVGDREWINKGEAPTLLVSYRVIDNFAGEHFRVHGRHSWAPRARQPEQQCAHQGQRMAVDGAQIDRPTGAAARAETSSHEFRRAVRPGWSVPQHITAGGQAPIPAINDELGLEA